MTIEAPDLTELAQLCDFAETRLNQLAGVDPNYNNSDDDAPSPWEWGCLTKAQAWLHSLKELNGAKKIELALEVLEEEGVVQPGAVERIVTISTAHITEQTNAGLGALPYSHNGNPWCLTTFPKGDFGWWVRVPQPGEMPPPYVPEELGNAIEYARSLGCTWLCLDRDGDKTHALPEFDW